MSPSPRPYPSGLSDAEWAILAPLIPPAKPGGRPRKWPMRTVLNGVFYVLRSGCAWRLLPHDFPPWQTVYHYARLFRLDGTWEQLNTTLRERERVRQGRNEQPSACIIDSKSVKTTTVGGIRGYDGAKKVSGRKEPNLPLAPGTVERREFEYIRRGTRSFILNRDVVTGQIIAPSDGPTRTEQDFLEHIKCTVPTDPAATRWHFVTDNLDTHRSESLVRFVAAASGLEIELEVKSTSGILASRQTRAAFLSDPSHRIVVHSTPKHASWRNQIEIWLLILVRKLLRRGSFISVEDLVSKVREFIAYYNRTMAKPFRWTYQGKALVA